MRTNEERVAAVKQRAAQLERQKRLRQKRLLALACACASLAVIVVQVHLAASRRAAVSVQ